MADLTAIDLVNELTKLPPNTPVIISVAMGDSYFSEQAPANVVVTRKDRGKKTVVVIGGTQDGRGH